MNNIENLLQNRKIEETVTLENLKRLLNTDRNLRVKYGIDPNMPSPHIGHVVPLSIVRELQDLGHTAVFIVGDYTARIGDPTGKSLSRPIISKEQIESNLVAYFQTASKVLRGDLVEVRRQSEWFSAFTLDDVFKLFAKATHSQLMQHETFRLREMSGGVLHMHELIYPFIQAYDSIAVNADIEVGGIDQKYNFMLTRSIQERYGQPAEQVIMMRYLHGLDGKEKMSKSLGNTVNLTDDPNTMYGKIMSIPDALLKEYFELATDLEVKKIDEIMVLIASGRLNPMFAKKDLAKHIVERYHSEEESQKADEWFSRTFQQRKMRSHDYNLVEIRSDINIIDFLIQIGCVISKSEAKRLLQGGAIELNGEKVITTDINLRTEDQLRIGKKRFIRFVESS